jgi:hypothetical protein
MSGAEPVIDQIGTRATRWSGSFMAADRALHKRAVILIHC